MRPETPGMKFLLQLARAQLDPDFPEPEPPPGKPARPGRNPADLVQLRRMMAERLTREIRSRLRRNSLRIFRLTPEQVHTLRTLGMPEGLVELLESLDCAMLLPTAYSVNRRLELIATLPGSSPELAPDWQTWWLEASEENRGIPEWDRNPEDDGAALELDRAVRLAARAAGERMPAPVDAFNHVRERGEWSSVYQRREPLGKNPVRLSHVWGRLDRAANLARGLGLEPEPVPDPETVLESLGEAGTEVLRDMGTVGPLTELRRNLGGRDAALVEVNARDRLWWDREASQCAVRRRPWSDPRGTRLWTEPGAEPAGDLSPEEWRLLGLTAPPHPGLSTEPDHHDKLAQAAAFVNGTTVDHARAFLAGTRDNPERENPPACPRAGECPTHCGRLHREGTRSFPLTDDGRFESCGYWRFLESCGSLEPARRAPVAQARVEEMEKLAGRKARREQPAPEAATDTAPPDEPATEPETAQASLF